MNRGTKKRLTLIVTGAIVVIASAAMVLSIFEDNIVFFFSPSQVAANEAPQGRAFRIGGYVKEGSVQRQSDGLTVVFNVTDTDHEIPVSYKGSLPDMFKEGKGVVAQGKLNDGVFVADQVLAKHDENYMPPEAEKAVQEAHAKIRAQRNNQ